MLRQRENKDWLNTKLKKTQHKQKVDTFYFLTYFTNKK